MPELSNLLENLIEDRNTNVFQISKNTKLDRTTLQRTLKGERLPSQNFIEKLCDYLNVFPSEKEEVLKQYKIKKIGKGVYNNRLFIKNMFEQIAMISHNNYKEVLNNRDINIDYIKKQKIRVVEGNNNVISILSDILQDEFYNHSIPSLKLKIPFSFTYLFDLIKSTCATTDKDFSIQHILKLGKSTTNLANSNYNLKVLTDVLPFAFMKYGNYTPYYYYGAIKQSVDSEIPFPFYILTSKYLIQLSSNFDKIIIESDANIISIFNSSFDSTLQHSRKFINALNNPVDLTTAYLKHLTMVKKCFLTIEAQPCFGQFFDKEFINKKIYKEIPQHEQLVLAANTFYDKLRATQSNHYNYFSIEGLEYFVEHGQITDVPDGCSSPFTKKEILHLLIQLKEHIISDEFTSRAINNSNINAPTNSAFLLFDDTAFILTNRREDGSLVACLIDESTISHSMLDFSKSFEDEGFLYSKKETILAIDEIINKIS